MGNSSSIGKGRTLKRMRPSLRISADSKGPCNLLKMFDLMKSVIVLTTFSVHLSCCAGGRDQNSDYVGATVPRSG